ncbi:MAG TPA: class I SAM-dependent methyltransferase [Ornithinibacter sp.]|nr:class I SAM-dependent methyltransferase [Ornithinibacter sp.]
MTSHPTHPAATPHSQAPHPLEGAAEAEQFDTHPARGRFNAAFFHVMGGYLDRHLRERKAAAFADLPPTVVELGAGVGANLRYLPDGAHLIAIEPNPYMHPRLTRAARSRGIDLEIRSVVGERMDLPDAGADAVISSLVLCSVRDPQAVVAEVRRVLRPGGRFSFAEHVGAEPGTATRWTQRVLRRPWAWTFEGCSCERDLAGVIRSAGFSSVELTHYRVRSPFVPFNTHIAGTAIS